jgi:hypothetical protein
MSGNDASRLEVHQCGLESEPPERQGRAPVRCGEIGAAGGRSHDVTGGSPSNHPVGSHVYP